MRKVLHLLGDFNDEDIEWLIDVGFKKTIHPQELLIQANHKLHEIYFVLTGKIDIELPDGILFAKIKSGEILGEMSFIENELPIVNAKAIEKTDIISISHQSITERFKLSPDFEGRFYKAMSLYLSSRLRNVAAKISYKNSLTSFGKEFEQDMNNATLDRIQIAGERFNRLLHHFR
jgi:CRP/FNR family cyclic AMP-dependent transcriptional regulator|tara:strand:- start:463 stop:990 length:528 start_codon:yes stop_codon:yes gene_type:complete